MLRVFKAFDPSVQQHWKHPRCVMRNLRLESYKVFHLILVPEDVTNLHVLLDGEGRGASSPGLRVFSSQSTLELLTMTLVLDETREKAPPRASPFRSDGALVGARCLPRQSRKAHDQRSSGHHDNRDNNEPLGFREEKLNVSEELPGRTDAHVRRGGEVPGGSGRREAVCSEKRSRASSGDWALGFVQVKQLANCGWKHSKEQVRMAPDLKLQEESIASLFSAPSAAPDTKPQRQELRAAAAGSAAGKNAWTVRTGLDCGLAPHAGEADELRARRQLPGCVLHGGPLLSPTKGISQLADNRLCLEILSGLLEEGSKKTPSQNPDEREASPGRHDDVTILLFLMEVESVCSVSASGDKWRCRGIGPGPALGYIHMYVKSEEGYVIEEKRTAVTTQPPCARLKSDITLCYGLEESTPPPHRCSSPVRDFETPASVQQEKHEAARESEVVIKLSRNEAGSEDGVKSGPGTRRRETSYFSQQSSLTVEGLRAPVTVQTPKDGSCRTPKGRLALGPFYQNVPNSGETLASFV
ncbi:hypothetical protein CB1_001033042 [Camelus ferus]|nr:hypothetical protein CB1_001033042 [Camelus ferus]